MMIYSVITTHELTPEELQRAPKGLRRTSIETHYRKAEALEAFGYQRYLLDRLGFADSLELRRNGVVICSSTSKED